LGEKSRRMRCAGHAALVGERRDEYRVLVGKPEGMRALGRPRHSWRVILRWIFRKWIVGAWSGLSWLWIGTCGTHL